MDSNAALSAKVTIAIDQHAQQQLTILGTKSALYKIQLKGRMLHLLIWIVFTMLGIYFSHTIGLGIFILGIINYLILLSFRLGNFFLKKGSILNQVMPAGEQWPSFSIIFPLKNENEVIHKTIQTLQALDYPTELVQVIVVVEQTDEVTLESLRQIRLPAHFELLCIPEMPPFTKGRALLHALDSIRGTYVTVYDAESRPEPQQLRKAALSLINAPGEICCQAKISISNHQENWITRNFAGEYYEWYEQHLLELSTANLPFGLGGNSFFISKRALIDAGAWDPFNVTEDADLSVRLVQNGVRLSILDSYTTETCPESVENWINQRTRWNKGLFITQLVHLKRTLFDPHFKISGWLSFWLRMICASLLPFFNIYVALYILLADLPFLLSAVFSAVLWVLLGANLLLSWIINIITYRRLGITQSILLTFWDSFRYLFLHIIAGYKSFWEYFTAPLQWNKTVH